MNTQKKGVEKGQVIQLNLVRIERNRERKCTCKNPIYLVDVTNDFVECETCHAEVKAIKALEDVGIRHEEMNATYNAMEKRSAELMEHWDTLVRIEKIMKPLKKFFALFARGN